MIFDNQVFLYYAVLFYMITWSLSQSIVLVLVVLDLIITICDVVAVAKILNATLVIPHFEVNHVWQDSRYIQSLLFFQPLYG